MNESSLFKHLARLCVALLVATVMVSGCGGKSSEPDAILAKVKQEREKREFTAAIINLKNLLQQVPDNSEARYLLGLTYSDSGDFRSAESDLRRALELGYDKTKVIPTLGKALLNIGEFQKVLDQTKVEGEMSNQTQAEILTLRAQASLALGKVPDARQLLEQALAKQPDHADALLAQARIAATDKKLEDSAQLIEKAVSSAPKSVDAWLLKGDLLRATADLPGARAAYQKVLELSADNIPARLNIASLEIDGGKFDEATKYIDEVRKIAPNNPLAIYMQGLIEFRKENYSGARDKVQQVLKAAPNHLPSVLLAGAVEVALGTHTQAQIHLGKVLASAPGNLYARKLMISSLAKTGQLQRAIEVLQPGLKQAPDDASLMALAGELYVQSNDFSKATEFFGKAAKIDPKSAGARTGLGLSRLAAGETSSAMADLESAAQLDSSKYQADVLLIMTNLRQGSYDKALKALESLEKKQPDNPLTFNLKAAIFIGKKDTVSARKHLEHALKLQPNYVTAAVNLAQLDLQDKKPDSARRRLESIVEKDKDNVQALLTLANLGPRIGASTKEVIDWLERARKADSGAVQPQVMLALAYAQSGEGKKALEVAQLANTANPENVEVLDTLGSIQLGTGAREQALVTFGKLAVLQPASPLAHYRLASAQAANANRDAALASLKKSLELKPDFIDAHVALVDLHLRAAQFGDAMKTVQVVKKQAAKSPVGFTLEGDVLMAEKKYSQAVKAYESAFGMAKSAPLVIKLHAAAAAMGGKTDEADARLTQWLKDSPEDVPVRLYVADASLKTGKYKNAIEHYEWLVGKQPDNFLVLNNLAWAYQQTKDSRALATAERAFKIKPDNAAVVDTLGWMLVEQGNTTRGIELLQKAVSAAPKSQEIRFHLAQAWLKAGDKTKAREELERLLAIDGKFAQHTDAANLLKQLKN